MNWKSLFLIPILLGMSQIIYGQNIIQVSNVPGDIADYTDLQEAITAAQDGDIIYVYGSSKKYGPVSILEYLIIDKAITLIGPGYLLAENPNTQNRKNDAFLGRVRFVTGSSGATIMGFRFGDIIELQSDFLSTNLTFKRNYFSNGIIRNNSLSNSIFSENLFFGSNGIGASNFNNVLFSNNIFRGRFSITGVGNQVEYNIFYPNSDFGSTSNATFRNNIFLGDNLFIENPNRTNNQVTNNVIVPNIPALANDNLVNVPVDQLFKGYPDLSGFSTDGQLELVDNSPAKGYATDGTDAGIFGGVTPYKLSGIPSIPRIYQAIIPTFTSPNNGLNIRIKASSN